MRHYWSHGEKPRRGAHDFLWVLWRWSALGFVQPDGRGAPRDALAAIRPAAKRVIRGCRRLVPGGRVSAARLGFGYGTAPLANAWFERGMPVHRHYLEQFLASSAADIRGRCLEFQEDSYSTRFGGSRVSRVDILHKESDPRYPQATLHADLTAANDIPGGAFDCIVCTYVLHVIPDLDRFVAPEKTRQELVFSGHVEKLVIHVLREMGPALPFPPIVVGPLLFEALGPHEVDGAEARRIGSIRRGADQVLWVLDVGKREAHRILHRDLRHPLAQGVLLESGAPESVLPNDRHVNERLRGRDLLHGPCGALP